MSVITPKDLAGASFSNSFKGYNKAEVDEYISKVLKNYSILYRRCAELEEQVAVAKLRLEKIDTEEKRAQKTLEEAKLKSDKMISEACTRADDILVAIKKNCDAILRDFRDKVDTQKDALAEMNARVELFKKDIFSKYKQHIELIERLSPPFEFEEDLSSNEYVARVIEEIKHDITAEYDIAVGYDDGSERDLMDDGRDELPTEEEISAFINTLTKKNIIEEEEHIFTEEPQDTEAEDGGNIVAPDERISESYEQETDMPEDDDDVKDEELISEPPYEDGADEPETEELPLKEEEVALKIVIPSKIQSTKKRKKQLRSVLEMLREYEEEDARNIPKIEAQFMLNLDDATDSLVETKNKNKK